MTDEIAQMVSWVLEIQEGMVLALVSSSSYLYIFTPLIGYAQDNSTFLFTNYLSIPPEPSDSNFYDAAASALFSYSVYLLSNLLSIHTYIPEAEKIRQGMTLLAPSQSKH